MRKDKLKKIIRLHEKIKEIRQQFLQAVTYGRLSGSGKVVFEFYDEPVHWGDSPWQNHCDVVQARKLLILLKMKVTEVMAMMAMEKKKVPLLSQQRKVRKYLEKGIFKNKVQFRN